MQCKAISCGLNPRPPPPFDVLPYTLQAQIICSLGLQGSYRKLRRGKSGRFMSKTFPTRMTDHAGPRHPGSNFWHPPVEVTQFWYPAAVLAPVFVRPKKIILIKRRGKSMKKVVGNGLSYCFVLY